MYYRAGYFLYIVAMLVFLLAMPLVSQVYAQSTPPVDGGLVVDCGFGESKMVDGKEVGRKDCGVEHVFELAENVVRVLIWLAVTGFVLVLIWFGAAFSLNAFLYAGDAQQAVSRAKNGLKLATFGLILVLGAWLLVRSFFGILGYVGDPFVPPDLPKDSDAPFRSSELPEVSVPSAGAGFNAGGIPAPSPPGCDTCVSLGGDSGVVYKPPGSGCMRTHTNCYVNSDLLTKLSKNYDDTDRWQITESWPPTITHACSCHSNGTCVDVNFINENGLRHQSVRVKEFINVAESHGLTAVYEVPNQEQKDELLRLRGDEDLVVADDDVKVVNRDPPIVPRFSVYLNGCDG